MKTSPTVLFTAALTLGGASPATVQEAPASLSLEEAVTLFVSRSPELRSARSALRSGLADARQGRAARNPTFSLTNEDLGQYSERYFNLNQPIEHLWERGARGRRADAGSGVARAAFAADSAGAVLELRRTFVDAWYGARVVTALEEADAVVVEVLGDVVERVVPTVLIGTSGQPGIFGEKLVRGIVRDVPAPFQLMLHDALAHLPALPVDPGGRHQT